MWSSVSIHSFVLYKPNGENVCNAASPITPSEPPPWKRRAGSGSAAAGSGFPVVEIFTPYGSELERRENQQRQGGQASYGVVARGASNSRPGSGGREKVRQGIKQGISGISQGDNMIRESNVGIGPGKVWVVEDQSNKILQVIDSHGLHA